MLVTLCADKGAPGVTTTAVALALTWPRPVTLVEADPAGADLPYRLRSTTADRLSLKAGLVSYAVAVRAGGGGANLAAHTQTADGDLHVVIGPAGPEQAAALGRDWRGVATGLAGHRTADVIVDAGRLISPSSPAMAVATASDRVVLVVADTAEAAAHLRHGVHTLTAALNAATTDGQSRAADRLGVFVVASGHTGRSPQAAAQQVRDVLRATPGASHVPVWGALPYDLKAAAILSGHTTGRLRRRPLLKHAATCAAALAGDAAPLADTTERAVGTPDAVGQGAAIPNLLTAEATGRASRTGASTVPVVGGVLATPTVGVVPDTQTLGRGANAWGSAVPEPPGQQTSRYSGNVLSTDARAASGVNEQSVRELPQDSALICGDEADSWPPLGKISHDDASCRAEYPSTGVVRCETEPHTVPGGATSHNEPLQRDVTQDDVARRGLVQGGATRGSTSQNDVTLGGTAQHRDKTSKKTQHGVVADAANGIAGSGMRRPGADARTKTPFGAPSPTGTRIGSTPSRPTGLGRTTRPTSPGHLGSAGYSAGPERIASSERTSNLACPGTSAREDAPTLGADLMHSATSAQAVSVGARKLRVTPDPSETAAS